jgi:hypothetical protein
MLADTVEPLILDLRHWRFRLGRNVRNRRQQYSGYNFVG